MPRSRQLKLSVFDDPVLAELGHGPFRLLLAIWQLCDAHGWVTSHRRALWRHAFGMGSTTQKQSDQMLSKLIEGGQLLQGEDEEVFYVPSFLAHNSVHPREEKALAGTSRDLPVPVPPDARRDLSRIKNQESVSVSFKSTNGAVRTAVATTKIPDETDGFVAFYRKYPKHRARGAAARAYNACLRKAVAKDRGSGGQNRCWREMDPVLSQYLIDRVVWQLQQDEGEGLNVSERFLPLPATWLNQARYKDGEDE